MLLTGCPLLFCSPAEDIIYIENCLFKASGISEVKLIIDYPKSWQNSKLRHEGEDSSKLYDDL